MDLKSFLKWEEPVKAYGSSTIPQVYLTRKLDDKLLPSGGKLVINNAWLKKNMDELSKTKGNHPVPVAVSIDREKKFFVVAFNPPQDIPQYVARKLEKISSSITLSNKVLCDDVWNLMDMPINVAKQYLETELFHKEGKVIIWKFTYDPRNATNMQIQANAKIPKKK